MQATARAEQEQQIALALAQRYDGETTYLVTLAQGNWLGINDMENKHSPLHFKHVIKHQLFKPALQNETEIAHFIKKKYSE